jgi:hypothetical protein
VGVEGLFLLQVVVWAATLSLNNCVTRSTRDPVKLKAATHALRVTSPDEHAREHTNCRTSPLCTYFVVLYASFCIRDVS